MRFKSSIIRASGVSKGIVSTKRAWKMPMLSNKGFKVQPRVKSNLKMMSSANTVAATKAGYRRRS